MNKNNQGLSTAINHDVGSASLASDLSDAIQQDYKTYLAPLSDHFPPHPETFQWWNRNRSFLLELERNQTSASPLGRETIFFF